MHKCGKAFGTDTIPADVYYVFAFELAAVLHDLPQEIFEVFSTDGIAHSDFKIRQLAEFEKSLCSNGSVLRMSNMSSCPAGASEDPKFLVQAPVTGMLI